MQLRERDGISRKGRLQDNEVQALQRIPQEAAQRFGVLHQEDGLGAVSLGCRADRARYVRGNIFYSGKVNLECGSAARLAVDPDDPATLFHSSVHGGESEPRAFPKGFRSEERFEDS